MILWFSGTVWSRNNQNQFRSVLAPGLTDNFDPMFLPLRCLVASFPIAWWSLSLLTSSTISGLLWMPETSFVTTEVDAWHRMECSGSNVVAMPNVCLQCTCIYGISSRRRSSEAASMFIATHTLRLRLLMCICLHTTLVCFLSTRNHFSLFMCQNKKCQQLATASLLCFDALLSTTYE